MAAERAHTQSATGENQERVPDVEAINSIQLSDSELALIELYFDHCNQAFPIFSRFAFLTSMLRHSFRTAADEGGAALRASAMAMLSLALRMHAMCETENVASGDEKAASYLERAATELTTLMLAKPSVAILQALVIVACAMLASTDPTSKASVVIAVAVRQAQSLDLHLLDTLAGLSPAERLERIRIFWCLYILDKELSLRLCKPSLLSEDDLCVLSPQAVSEDRIGLLTSEDGELQLSMFAARQQLSRIQSTVYARLYTFNARHTRVPEKEQAVEVLNVALQQWREAWLANYHILQMGTWSSWALIHVVRLHFAYFHTLALANPKVPADDYAVRQKLDEVLRDSRSANEAFANIPPALLDSARAVFTAAARIRHGGLGWLMEALRFVLPAVLIVLQAVIADPCALTARETLDHADTWIEVLQLLRSRGSEPDVQEPGIATQLRELAERAVQSAGA